MKVRKERKRREENVEELYNLYMEDRDKIKG